tara:strand:- start:6695 stop:7246 length:552 start_codon:yes stop_codon:yes gene_type:complete
MFDWSLFLVSTLLGSSITISYFLVFTNVSNSFYFDGYVPSYIESPYWFGLSKNNVYVITSFQLLAALGYIMWIFWICFETDFGSSILRFRWTRSFTLTAFLLSSTLWPYAAYYYMLYRTIGRSILCCGCLWVASISVIIMLAGTFEANPPFYATLGILLLSNVVVLADGIGWSAICIQNALYK